MGARRLPRQRRSLQRTTASRCDTCGNINDDRDVVVVVVRVVLPVDEEREDHETTEMLGKRISLSSAVSFCPDSDYEELSLERDVRASCPRDFIGDSFVSCLFAGFLISYYRSASEFTRRVRGSQPHTAQGCEYMYEKR